MTVILVEGPDGTGKTGYASWLADEIGFVFLRLEPDSDFGNLDGEVIERISETFNETLVQLDRQDIDLAVDRGPVSSIVYSRIFGRARPDHAYRALERLDPLIVYLRCEPRELGIRYDDDKFSDVEYISEEYEEVMETLSTEFTIETIDTSSGAPSTLTDLAHRWVVEEPNPE